jgi:V8-like Glu-specific endopeptidase
MQTTFLPINKNIKWSRFNSSFIIEVERGNQKYTSTAVAIDSRVLVTAAHCVDCAESVNLILGDNYKEPEAVQKVSQWRIHPGYNPSKSLYENDIAVIFLDKDLPEFTGIEAVWGNLTLSEESLIERIGFGGRNDENIRTWTNPSFESVTFNRRNFILKDSSSVIGDSGGPVYTEDSGVLKLIGIHSTLEGSDKTYVVNIGQYEKWISNQLDIKEDYAM